LKIDIDSTLRKRKISTEGLKLTLCALPFVIFVFIFHYLPLFGWSFAFFDYKPGLSLSQAKFVGLKYFKYMFEYSNDITRVLRNTLVLSFMSLATSILPVMFSIMLKELRNLKFKKIIQSFVTLPHFISWVIVYSLCFAIFSTNGMYNNLMKVLNITDKPNTVLSTSKYLWTFMTTLDIWKGLGWSTIIYLAAIAGIDSELYEAAVIDGAGRFRCIWHITVPSLMETYIVLLLLAVGSLLSIGLDKYLNFKNPLNASKIEVLDLYIYRIGLMTHDYSFATAIGIAKSFVSIGLLFIVNKLAKKVRGESII
jgi:putative aldouronate transport system permease protein